MKVEFSCSEDRSLLLVSEEYEIRISTMNDRHLLEAYPVLANHMSVSSKPRACGVWALIQFLPLRVHCQVGKTIHKHSTKEQLDDCSYK